jgi:hypothetical protein
MQLSDWLILSFKRKGLKINNRNFMPGKFHNQGG